MPHAQNDVNLELSLSLVESAIDMLEQDLPELERMAAQAPHWHTGAVTQARENIAYMLSRRDELIEQIATQRVEA